jgi:hypothetical protein
MEHCSGQVTLAINNHVPRFTNFRKQRPAWITQEIVRKIRKKKRAWRAWKHNRSKENEERYEKLQRETTTMVRKATRRQERDLANDPDKNGKKFTKYIKSKSNCRSTIGPLKNINGQLVTEDNDMANMLNMFFTSVFTREDTSNIPAIEK